MCDEQVDNRILILDHDATMRLFSLDVAIDAVEAAYRAHATETARLFPVVREHLEDGAACGSKSGYWPTAVAVSLKVAGSWSANRTRGLETHQATVVLCDAATGRLRALINGNAVTTQRTAAAGAVGLRALARPDLRSMAVLGTGTKALAQTLAARHVYPHLHVVRVWTRNTARARTFVDLYESASLTLSGVNGGGAM